MKRLLTILAFNVLLCVGIWAVQAWPGAVEVKQPDGTYLTILLHGDEDFHYYTTDDGVLLVQQDGKYFIARTEADGHLTATTQLAHKAANRSQVERQLVEAQDKQAFLTHGMGERVVQQKRREPINTEGTTLFPHIGSPKAIVILAEFNDTTFTIDNPKRSFEDYFNSNQPLESYGFGEQQNITSVAQYFKNVSMGAYKPQFDIYGPVTLPSPLKTYGGTTSGGTNERMDLLLKDACTLLDDTLDFTQYDADGDGYVDLVVVIYAGYSESMSGNSVECIWPKSGTVTSAGSYDGKRVWRYAVSAELNGFPGCWSKEPFKRINGIGTLCHEFCHTLGMPDFYPTVNSIKGDNQGMEYWSLMDSGNYNGNGYYPVALNAWEREAFEWIQIPTLEETAELEIKPLDEGGTAYRIVNDNDNNEYYVIENIQKIGHNIMQRGKGLLVYHVNYDPTSFSLSSNSVNNIKGSPRMTVVPADGLLFASYNVGKTIDGVTIVYTDFYNQLAGDPFPGTSGLNCVNDTLDLVNFHIYNGDTFNKGLENITQQEDGTITLKYVQDITDGIFTATTVTSPRHDDGQYYTIDGRRAGSNFQNLPSGIYIRGGKKQVKL